MRRPFLPSLFVLVATFFFILEHARGAPVVNPVSISSVVRRGDPNRKLNQQTQYHTVHTTQTALGPVTETCDITLTPFIADDGCELVREDRKCTVDFVPNGAANSNSNSNGNSNNGDNGNIGNNNNTDTSGSSTSTDITPNSGQNGATIVSSGTADGFATTSADSASSTNGVGLSSTSIAAGSPQNSGAVAGDNTPTSTAPPPGSSLTSTNSAAPDSSPTQFKLPGTQLSVLPIGLGVFGGVSVIALIVVGLVTYERTKYRKAFRQRKLAEQGQAPGMSERPTIS